MTRDNVSSVCQGSDISKEIPVASGFFGLVQVRIQTLFQVTPCLLSGLDDLGSSAPIKHLQRLRATNAHLFFFWKNKDRSWVQPSLCFTGGTFLLWQGVPCPRDLVSTAYNCWEVGGHDGKSLYSKSAQSSAMISQPEMNYILLLNSRKIPTFLGSNNGTMRFLNS